MNILVLSERFSKGGLETHINTYYENLKREHKIVFAFANYSETNYLQEAEIYTNFHFSRRSTIAEFLEDVKNIVDLINKYKIDVIHVHPFYTLFPTLFAANITETKIVYTCHGRGSFNFIDTVNDEILYKFAIEEILGRIFCVANNAVVGYNKIKDIAIHIPNIIDENTYKEHQPVLNKTWAFVSRLDPGKVEDFKNLILQMDDLDIKQIDVYGDGAEKGNLIDFVERHGIGPKVFFKEYSNNIFEDFEGKYTGIIGIGRASLEALCMNYPCFLIGYGKVVGIIDEEIFDGVSDLNFVPTEINAYDKKTIIKQIKDINSGKIQKYQFRKTIIKKFGLTNIKKYIRELEKIKSAKVNVIEDVYNDIQVVMDKSENFYESENIFNILKHHIGFYTLNLDLKNTINLYAETFKTRYLINKSGNYVADLLESKQKQENELLKQEIERLNLSVESVKRIGIFRAIKNDLKKIFRRK